VYEVVVDVQVGVVDRRRVVDPERNLAKSTVSADLLGSSSISPVMCRCWVGPSR
jgi:hypothetical protein